MAPSRKERVLGGLLGVHAGDALGATLEFQSWESIKRRYPQGLREIVGGGHFRWPAGHATDDTDLTRAVLLAYRDRSRAVALEPQNSDFDLPLIAGKHMLDWLNGDWPDRQPGTHPRDVGGATLGGLLRFQQSGDPQKAGAGVGQAGNGSLMRCLPTGLFVREAARIVRESMLISGITHDDPRCVHACAAYNVIVHALIEDCSPSEAVEKALSVVRGLEGSSVPSNGVGGVSQNAERPVEDAIILGTKISVADLAENGPSPFRGKAAGYVLDSLAIAVAAVLDSRSLADVLVDVIRIGRDTDTNGAIAGGLLGVRDGVDGLPNQWRQVLQFGDEFSEIVTEILASEGEEHVRTAGTE